jgi:UDP-glucuronate 4-epimerase
MSFIEAIERALGREAIKNFEPIQPGDVPATWASTDDLANDVDYQPKTPIDVGVQRFVDWYLAYYGDPR